MNKLETEWYNSWKNRRDTRSKFIARYIRDPRRQRLFAVACCDNIRNDVNIYVRKALIKAERLADSDIPLDDLQQMKIDLRNAHIALANKVGSNLERYGIPAAIRSISPDACFAATWTSILAVWASKDPKKELKNQASIFWSISGTNMAWSKGWNNQVVATLANNIYNNKEWKLLPILADALEEAGCVEARILDQLRNKNRKWYRGDWIIDHARGIHDNS